MTNECTDPTPGGGHVEDKYGSEPNPHLPHPLRHHFTCLGATLSPMLFTSEKKIARRIMALRMRLAN
ncbi:MAG: hypothetical protein OJF47_001896 [Nitrospira sp.]|nr:MAG: hypothetical protein OJF47_001896 [Nitrospira sp.]